MRSEHHVNAATQPSKPFCNVAGQDELRQRAGVVRPLPLIPSSGNSISFLCDKGGYSPQHAELVHPPVGQLS
jgi:hypothetical protein